MDVYRRVALCRMIEQIEANESYSKRLGIENKSFLKEGNKKEINEKAGGEK